MSDDDLDDDLDPDEGDEPDAPVSLVPEWYEDNFVNVENLLIDLFTKLFPAFETGCWCPDDWLDEQIIVDPTIWVFRLPGGVVDWQRRTDECFMQVNVVTGSRDDSWEVMNAIRAILLPMSGDKFTMDDGYTAQFHSCSEITGPEALTEAQQIDTRIVTAVFRIGVGMKTAKNYKKVIAEL